MGYIFIDSTENLIYRKIKFHSHDKMINNENSCTKRLNRSIMTQRDRYFFDQLKELSIATTLIRTI